MYNSQINDNLYLVSQIVPHTSPKAVVKTSTNHIVVVDCSGSMWDALPKIREQIKLKVPTLLAEGDTLSIIWFSGRSECGILFENEPVSTLKDLARINQALDRWLRPVGLTGFKEPLVLATEVASRLQGPCSLFFLTDGYDNQWSKEDIIKATKNLATKLSSSTFVEYGYYCNHPLLVEMAEQSGGTIIFSEDFQRYEPIFDAAIKKQALSSKRVEVWIKQAPISGFCFAIDNGNFLTFKVEDGKISVPEHILEVYYLLTEPSLNTTVKQSTQDFTELLYAAVALYAQRMKADVVLSILKKLGDVRFIDLFAGCFGKQKYAQFVDEATKATFDHNLRFTNGVDYTRVPADDAFTVLDLLRILASDEDNHLLIDSDDFKYNRIGRAREQEGLTEQEQEQVDDLRAKLETASTAEKRKLNKQIAAIVDPKKPLKFVPTPLPKGVSISKLEYTEERPNIGLLIKREGTVDLKAKKAGAHKKIPDEFKTFTWRKYSIIKDGLVNVEKLPVRITGATVRNLREAGVPLAAIQAPNGGDRAALLEKVRKASTSREFDIVFDLTALPIINRKMVKDVSALEMFETEVRLTAARCEQKVYNSVRKEIGDEKTSEGFAVLYGKEEADWLKEIGITDYSGFSPPGKLAKAKDVYLGKEMAVKIKGLSTMPSLKDLREKIAKGKELTGCSAFMADHLETVDEFINSEEFKKAPSKSALFKTWNRTHYEASQREVQNLIREQSEKRFSIIVGQIWFNEFNSLDENTLKFKFQGEEYVGTAELVEKEFEI